MSITSPPGADVPAHRLWISSWEMTLVSVAPSVGIRSKVHWIQSNCSDCPYPACQSVMRSLTTGTTNFSTLLSFEACQSVIGPASTSRNGPRGSLHMTSAVPNIAYSWQIFWREDDPVFSPPLHRERSSIALDNLQMLLELWDLWWWWSARRRAPHLIIARCNDLVGRLNSEWIEYCETPFSLELRVNPSTTCLQCEEACQEQCY